MLSLCSHGLWGARCRAVAVIVLLAAAVPLCASEGSIIAWGSATSPDPNTGFTAVVAGGFHSLGLKSDGSVFAWGDNSYGQCDVPSPGTDFVRVAGGGFHSLGLKSDNSIVAWGYNDDAQCNVPSPNAGFTAVAGGYLHSLGLRSDGSIVAWGSNEYGQCDVPSPNEGFIAVAAGAYHSLGLKSDGSVVAWGYDNEGQCSVPSPNAGFTAIAGGIYHSLGLKSDGSIVMWGYDSGGAWSVPPPNSGFTAVAAGGYHNLGLRSDGTIVAWGQNYSNECSVPYPNAEFSSVAAGYSHSLGVRGPVSMLITFNPDGGFFLSPRDVVITCDTPDAIIHYTTSGVDPTEADPIVASGDSVLVDHPLTLKARPFKEGTAPGPVKSATYQFQVSMAWFEPYGGVLNAERNVVFRCATAGAVIHYRTDYEWPTEADPAVMPGDSMLVDHTMRLTVRAFKEGYIPSNVASTEFTMVAADPSVSPNGGTYESDQTVTLTCATPGAAIHYTTDGTEPDEEDAAVTSGQPILVGVRPPTTLKVRAFKDGYAPSNMVTAVYRAPILYRVKPSGSDTADGLTWDTAKRTVQAAINAAVGGDEVWVQAGTYVERVTLKDAVKLFGGFAGTETVRTERDWTANATILDGNQLGSVVTASSGVTSAASVDGFTVRNGKATYGGGVSCQGGSPRIANNVITQNTANTGGGICSYNHSSPLITGNRICDNTSRDTAAGVCCSYSDATITGNEITGNIVTDSSGNGGGIVCDHASPTISGNIIDANEARYGGGMILSYSSAVISGNTVSHNAGEKGAGIDCGTNANVTISDNLIYGNTANWVGYGGGIFCGSCSPVIRNNSIWGNNGSYGAGIYCLSSSPEISNNAISSNGAEAGGGIGCSGSSPAISNNTITGNGASQGGGIWCADSSSPTISNNIIAGNSSGLFASGGSPVLRSNCVWNPDSYNYSGLSSGTGDIQADPKLVSVAYGELHIKPDSPCRDAGDDSVVLTAWLDMDGEERVNGDRVDIGADESDGSAAAFSPSIVRVSPSGDDANNGSTWTLSKRSLRAAIDSLGMNGGDVWVSGGTYPERIVVPSYVHVYGGFAGSETAREQRNPAGSVSALDGDGDGAVVGFTNAGFRTSTIDGLTIRHGTGYGSGVYCSLSSPVLANNVITGNSGSIGGGIDCEYSSLPLIAGNSITNNSASTGGGIYCYRSSPLITKNTISGNSSSTTGSGGGGIFCRESAPLITYNEIKSNISGFGGGGITAGDATVSGNLIIGNYGGLFDGGGGICCGNGAVCGNTIVGNSVGEWGVGGGIYVGNCSPHISNNIVAFNSSGIYNGKGIWWIGTPVLSHNCVYNPGSYDYYQCDPGTGDIQADPLFVDLLARNYHLAAGSPCIDVGWNGADGMTALDIDGEARICNGTVDLGADEYGGLTPELVTISEARTLPLNTLVRIDGAIVSAAWPNVFYVEADDRSCGIRVERTGHGLTADNQRANVVGKVTISSNGERCIAAETAHPAGTGAVRPLGMPARSLGVSGLDTTGLFVRTWGKVTQKGDGYFYLDDGSALEDGTLTGTEPNLGVRVICDPAAFTTGDSVEVTGIGSCFEAGEGRITRRILTQASTDARTVVP